MSIRTAAIEAAALAEQKAQEAAQVARDALVADARAQVEGLADPEGLTPIKGQDLEVVHVAAPLVVLTDGDLHLGVRGDEIRVVEQVDDAWTAKSEPVADLVELGRVLR